MSLDDIFVMVSSANEDRSVFVAAKMLEPTQDARVLALLFVRAEEPSKVGSVHVGT